MYVFDLIITTYFNIYCINIYLWHNIYYCVKNNINQGNLKPADVWIHFDLMIPEIEYLSILPCPAISVKLSVLFFCYRDVLFWPVIFKWRVQKECGWIWRHDRWYDHIFYLLNMLPLCVNENVFLLLFNTSTSYFISSHVIFL